MSKDGLVADLMQVTRNPEMYNHTIQMLIDGKWISPDCRRSYWEIPVRKVLLETNEIVFECKLKDLYHQFDAIFDSEATLE